jgi:hypothetical protein
MVFDPSNPVIDESQFKHCDWMSSKFSHIDGQEAMPLNMPEPHGQDFIMSAKVDADHASNTVTC